jgi:hypothetical protein
MHRPDSFGQVIQAHDLTSQRVSDKTAAALPNDLSIGMNSSSVDCATMPPVRTQCHLGSWMGWVAVCWRLLSQRLVRSPMVVILTPPLKTLLLRLWVGRWRASRIGFKNAMMLFMRGVLFGMSFGRKLHANA